MAVVPAIRELRYEFIAEEIATDFYLDLFQGLSLLNRRLYRQGQYLFIESIDWEVDISHVNPSEVTLTQIPNTWVSKNAHEKAYRLWREMLKQATQEVAGLPTLKPKWLDFKIFMDAAHYANQVGYGNPTKLPQTGYAAGSTLVAPSINNAEWIYAQIVVPNPGAVGSEFNLHMLGGDSAAANANIDALGSKAIIQGYADTRVTVSNEGEPPVPGDASNSWMVQMFDDGDTYSDIINFLEGDNDAPPYATGNNIQAGDNPEYPGGTETMSQGMPFAILRSMSNFVAQPSPVVSVPGGDLFCGLCKVQTSGPGVLVFHVGIGTYKGIASINVRDA